MAKLKKINCASLPPCTKTLLNHIKRAQYVARMWKRADETNPTGEASPTDYGWKLNQNCFERDWFPGNSVPKSLTTSTPEDTVGVISTDDEESDNTWSNEVMTVMTVMRKYEGWVNKPNFCTSTFITNVYSVTSQL